MSSIDRHPPRMTPGFILIAALLLMPVALMAQATTWDQPTVDFEVRSGASTPAGGFTRYARPGFFTGVGVAYWVMEGLAVRADGSLHALDGAETRDRLTLMPDARLWHGGVGVEYDWTHRDPSRVTLHSRVGIGATQLGTDFFEDPFGEPMDLSETYTTFTFGVDLGVAITEDIRFIFGSTAFLGVIEEDQLADLAAVNAAADPISNPLTYATSAGLRIDLPR